MSTSPPTGDSKTASPAGSGGWSRWREWVATVARVVLGVVWIWAGSVKIGDPADAVRTVRAYRILPESMVKAVAYGQPYVEISIGVLLLVGLATRVIAGLSGVALLAFIGSVASASIRGLQIKCGCFSAGGDLGANQTTAYTVEIVRDTGLFLVSAFLLVWPRSRYAVDDAIRNAGAAVVDTVRVGPRRTKEAQRRLAELAARRRREGERRVLLISLACVVGLVAVGGVGVGIQSKRAKTSAPLALPKTATVADGIVLGESTAKVRLDIYEDFQCPACKQFESAAGSVVQKAIADGTAKVHYHVISFLDRYSSGTRYSSRSASAAYCASDEGKFKELHDTLYQNQPEENGNGLTSAKIVELGKQAGLTDTTFAQCVTSEKYRTFVTAVTDQSSKDGVNATPTVKVNGKQVQSPDATSLQNAITAAKNS